VWNSGSERGQNLFTGNTQGRWTNCVFHGRVSTLDKGQDVNLQLNELRDYSERRGWHIAGEYVDNGVSGAKESRPELNRLMADAKKRRFDAIAVWKLVITFGCRPQSFTHTALTPLR
jgi:Resolvase, N terminal domain